LPRRPPPPGTRPGPALSHGIQALPHRGPIDCAPPQAA
jgi:hypothetical protein